MGNSLELGTIFGLGLSSLIMLFKLQIKYFLSAKKTNFDCDLITLKNVMIQNIAEKYTF